MTRSLTFNDLTHEQVVFLNNAYEKLISVAEKPESYEPQPVAGAQRLTGESELMRVKEDEVKSYQPQPIQQTNIPAPALDRAIEIDATGVPFNPEIHSEKKAKNQKGEWRMKRNANKEAFQTWKAEHTRAPQQPAYQPPAAPASADITAQVAPPSVVPVPTEPLHVPDYGTWHGKFTQVWGNGALNAEKLEQMNRESGVPDASEYVSNDQARAISFMFMDRLMAA